MRIFSCLRSSAFETYISWRVKQALAIPSDPLNDALIQLHKGLHMNRPAVRDFWRGALSFAFEQDSEGSFSDEQRAWLSKRFNPFCTYRTWTYPSELVIEHASFPPHTFLQPSVSATDLSRLIEGNPTASFAYDTVELFQIWARRSEKFRKMARVLPMERADYVHMYTEATLPHRPEYEEKKEGQDQKVVAVVRRVLALRDKPILVAAEDIYKEIEKIEQEREEDRERERYYKEDEEECEWEEDEDEDEDKQRRD